VKNLHSLSANRGLLRASQRRFDVLLLILPPVTSAVILLVEGY
jgi:hypothetical protein